MSKRAADGGCEGRPPNKRQYTLATKIESALQTAIHSAAIDLKQAASVHNQARPVWSIPDEVLLSIGSYLSTGDLVNLCLTTERFCNVFQDVLYHSLDFMAFERSISQSRSARLYNRAVARSLKALLVRPHLRQKILNLEMPFGRGGTMMSTVMNELVDTPILHNLPFLYDPQYKRTVSLCFLALAGNLQKLNYRTERSTKAEEMPRNDDLEVQLFQDAVSDADDQPAYKGIRNIQEIIFTPGRIYAKRVLNLILQLPSLQKLTVRRQLSVSTHAPYTLILDIPAACSTVTHLDLGSAGGLQKQEKSLLIKACKTLQHIRGCSDLLQSHSMLESLSTHQKALKSIHCCYEENEDQEDDLVTSIPNLTEFETLETLILEQPKPFSCPDTTVFNPLFIFGAIHTERMTIEAYQRRHYSRNWPRQHLADVLPPSIANITIPIDELNKHHLLTELQTTVESKQLPNLRSVSLVFRAAEFDSLRGMTKQFIPVEEELQELKAILGVRGVRLSWTEESPT